MATQETHAEFQARMDRAREKGAAESTRAAVVGIVIYVIGLSTYFYLKSGDWHGVYFLFVGVNLLLLTIAISLLIGIYRSRKT